GILAEHEVLAVEQRESLLVLALDRGLHRCFQRILDRIDEIDDRQVESTREAHPYLGRAALAVRRGADAVLAAEPREHRGAVERRAGREVGLEALLDQLSRERRRTRAGARILDADRKLPGKARA